MKILFYSHTGTVSGAENVLLLALKCLNRSRFTPTALCPAEGDLKRRIEELGVPCETIAPLEARFTWRADLFFKYLLSLLRTIKELRCAIGASKPDLIHANSIRAGLAATIATVGMKTPVLWHLQDELRRHPFSTGIRILALSSSRVRLIAASQATADSFRGTLLRLFDKRNPMCVVHNVIELERFHIDDRSRGKVREELGIGNDEFVVGVVGQITPRKGQLELVRTFAEACKEIPPGKLLIAGAPMFNKDGLYLEQLKNATRELGLEDRVRFLGKRNDIAALMQAFDVLVVNSKSEAFVIVALEAMACGTPVIATDVGGIREMIEHGVSGWLVPFGDERLLTEALTTLGRDAEMRSAFSNEGKRLVAEKFHAEKFKADIEECFERWAPAASERKGVLLVQH